jgi:hypothetical protein
MATYVGTVTVASGSTANIAVTGLAEQPSVLFLFGTRATAAGQVSHGVVAVGAFTGTTSRWAHGAGIEGGEFFHDHGSWTRDDCGFVMPQFLDPQSATEGRLDLVSFNSDGFTLAVDQAFDGNYELAYVAFAGADVTNAACGVTQTPSGAAGNFSITSLAFQPNFLLTAYGYDASPAINAVNATFAIGLGVATGSSNQVCVGAHARNTDPQDSHGVVATDAVVKQTVNNANTIGLELGFVSFNANGFTLNKVTPTGGGQTYFCWLAVEFATAPVVGTTTARTSIGTTTVSGLPFEPSGLLLFGRPAATATMATGADEAELTLGATDGTNMRCVTVLTPDTTGGSAVNEASKYQSRWDTSRLYSNLTHASAGSTTFNVDAYGTLSAFTSDGFTLSQDDADGQATLLGYVAVAGAAGGPTPGTIVRTSGTG